MATLSQFSSGATDSYAPFFNMLKGSKRFEGTDKCEQTFQALKEHLGRPSFLFQPIEGENLYLYIAIFREVVSAALVRKEEKT